ncbi:NB-ARC domain-containing protein [Calothrix sp. CCY 0018]|uniref:NB-ARC domain-containing protein n=1 Tax=Calothrix sp. CCY 0018 TaxID=3103864 RepID=UPI0039C68077
MFPTDFLTEMAHNQELSRDQEEVFLLRMGKGKSYEEIASELGTSADACLKRMGQVYKKFNVSGSSRGKENRLRIYLSNEWEQRKVKLSPENNSEQLSVNNQQIEITDSTSVESRKRSIVQNLPAREYSTFIGRDREVARLMELLDYRHSAHLISVDGIGGVGKTTIVVEVAYRCFISNSPAFEAIIFTSAKQNHLTSIGLLPRLIYQRTLRDICREIARIFEFSEINNLPLQEQIAVIRHKLSQIKTLLIVDNLETIEDKQEVLSFLYDLPPTVKVILTTREQTLFVPIRLNSLPKEHSLRLIQHEAKEKNVNLTNAESQQIYEAVSGVPAAMIYAIGQMAAGYLLEDVLILIKNPQGDIARFCFTTSINPLRDSPPYYLLIALTLFIGSVTRETITSVAFDKPDPIVISQGLVKLQQLSLIYRQQERYCLAALTREYAWAELYTNPQFAQELRQRWVNWYLKFSESFEDKDWNEWHLSYENLEVEWENLQAVLEWCISENRYSDVKTLWSRIKGYVHIRGYWDERLEWNAWLIEAAKRAGDWVTALDSMCDRAWILVRMRQVKQLQEAQILLQEAWELRQHHTLNFQLELAANMVILHVHLSQLQQAQEWLTLKQQLLEQANLDSSEYQEQQVQNLYYQGQIFYREGDLSQAQLTFEQALIEAQKIEWQKATAAINNWLADIALLNGDFPTCRKLLEFSLPMAQRHKDKRVIAFHKATFAKLEKACGNGFLAHRLAKEAAESFDSLKMSAEAQEMYDLLAN